MRLDLEGLTAASREALMAEWREVIGRPPPKHLSKPLMAQILSHAYQLDTVGGYTKRLDGRLKNAARRDVVRPAFKPGSRFMREYHGVTHVVEVSDDGRFVWNDPSRLASIASYLDFYGLEEARYIFIDYFDKKTRRTNKYPNELLWQNLCDIYFAMKKQPEWKDAPHEAIANEMFRKFGHRVKSNSYEAFASALAKRVKKYR